VDRINTGSVNRGTIHYSSLITPIFLNDKNPQNTYMISTGKNGSTTEMQELMTGQILKMNTNTWHNTYQYLFTGETNTFKDYFDSKIPPNDTPPTYFTDYYGVSPVQARPNNTEAQLDTRFTENSGVYVLN